MKKLLKRIAAVFCVTGILTATACGESTAVAMTADGVDINAGEYIFAQLRANYNATTKFKELNPDTDTEADGFDFYAQELEGKSFKDWVNENAISVIAKRRIYEKKFDELGLSLTAEELANLKGQVDQTWNEENAGLAEAGISEKTLGLYYEKLGISKDSYRKMLEADAKSVKVFDALYGEGGTREPSKDELLAEFERICFRFRFISISVTDANGEEITDEAELQELEDLGNSYVERLAAGESWLTVAADHEAYVKEQEALAAADEEETEEETDEETDEETEEDTEEETEEEAKTEEDYDYSIWQSEVEAYEYEVYDRIAEMPLNVPELYEDEYGYYVLLKLDIKEREDWLEENMEEVLNSLKGEEMDDEVAELAKSVEIVLNEAAIKRYDPKKAL